MAALRKPSAGRAPILRAGLAAAAIVLALLVGGCGGGTGTASGTSTTTTASSAGPYLDMRRLATAFQARLQKEDPAAFIVEVLCARTGPRTARCNVREDEATKGYEIRISADGSHFKTVPSGSSAR